MNANDPYQESAELIRNDDGYLRLRPFHPDRPDEPAEIFLNNCLWFSDIATQDDIFEGRPLFTWRETLPSADELRELARRQAPSLPEPERERIVEQFLRTLNDPALLLQAKTGLEAAHARLYGQSSVACFFRNVLGSRNWAAYADGGRGYGLIFDMSIPWTFEAFPDRGEHPWVPFEVNYVNQQDRPRIELAFAPSPPAFDDIQRALLTKSEEWREQREERLVRVGIPAGHVEFPATSLKAVILGHAILDAHKAMLADLLRRRELPLAVYQAMPSTQHLSMDLRPAHI